MEQNKYFKKEDYPMNLSPMHVQQILDIGRKQTYEFLSMVEAKIRRDKNPEFHLFRIGTSIKVPRDSFFNWMEGTNVNK